MRLQRHERHARVGVPPVKAGLGALDAGRLLQDTTVPLGSLRLKPVPGCGLAANR